MPNQLANETSPYLLQHKDNPVDWMPWSEEAWARARAEDRPVLVSIGYAACHWCHVMEHECFEDPEVAALMNASFVCLKVDREERPDVDAIYMEAVQAMTGQGGWPLNAFCTPEQVPFWAGTYFPPRPRPGMPSWPQVLEAITRTWDEKRDEIRDGAHRIVDHLGATARLAPAGGATAPTELLDGAVGVLREHADPEWGGWGSAPKFPQPSLVELLLGRGETVASLRALRAMARGGLFDQVAGGFARYSVDRTWTVPHFEKMLYDNAGLARAYLHGWLVSGDARLREVCELTLDWALREMRGPEGGFASSLDADAEGEEGRFSVWTLPELRAVLGEDAEAAIAWFGATERGNFEQTNVLRADGPRPERAAEIRAALLRARERRVRPGIDDKRVTSWNAMMVAALAEAGAVLGREDYRAAAVACAEFLLTEVRDPASGRLRRTWKDGRARLGGYLEDHAYALDGLLVLYEATFEERWFVAARDLAEVMLAHFADPERGGFFTTADDHERLIARRKDLEDSPIPSGNSAVALGLLRLAALTGEDRYRIAGEGVIALLEPLAARHPTAFGHLLRAVAFAAGPVREVALVGEDTEALARVVRGRFRPEVVLAGGTGSEASHAAVPLLRDRPAVEGRATAYVCEGFVCLAPVTAPAALAAALGDR